MTHENAIKCLKEIISPTGRIINISAVDLAVEALEKQIPKPLKELRDPNPIELRNDFAECPNCGEWLVKKMRAKHRYNYCPKCGQALDCEVEE